MGSVTPGGPIGAFQTERAAAVRASCVGRDGTGGQVDRPGRLSRSVCRAVRKSGVGRLGQISRSVSRVARTSRPGWQLKCFTHAALNSPPEI